MEKFEILCLLKAISNYAYDIHYTAQGKFFYSDHVFSERLADVDVSDDFIETMYLGESQDAPTSVEIDLKVAELTPAISEDMDANFKALREMIVAALIGIEGYQVKTRAEDDILGSVAHILQRHNGLLYRQLRYEPKENAKDEDIAEWVTVKGNHIPVKKGQSPKEAIEGFLKDKEKSGKTSGGEKAYYEKMSTKSRAIVDKAKKYEPSITKDITAEAKKQGVENLMLDSRLKSMESATVKANKDVAKGDYKTFDEAMENMFDLVRYTQSGTTDNLVEKAERTLTNLKAKGYIIHKIKNFFLDDDNPYSGVNVQMVSPAGVKLEIQFNTPKNVDVKERMHKIYDKTKDPNLSKEKLAQYKEQMKALAPEYEVPRDISKLSKKLLTIS